MTSEGAKETKASQNNYSHCILPLFHCREDELLFDATVLLRFDISLNDLGWIVFISIY